MSKQKKIANIMMFIFVSALFIFLFAGTVMLKSNPDIEPLLNSILRIFVVISNIVMITFLILRKDPYYIPGVVALGIVFVVYLWLAFVR